MPRAGQIIEARSTPGTVITYLRGEENLSTGDDEPVLLFVENVMLYADLQYRIEGWSRIRHLGSTANDGGRTGNLAIIIDGVTARLGRGTTNTQTNSSAGSSSVSVSHPAWTPQQTGVAEVRLEGSRAQDGSWDGHLEFRGSGGPQFEYWLAISIAGHAT